MKKIGKQVAFLASSKNNPRNGEGSFLRLNDGRIMYAYTDYYGTSWKDEATARISAIYSDDEGESWSDPSVLIEKEDDQLNIMSVSLVRMSNREIGIAYLEKVDAGDQHTYCMPIFRYSADDGKTFSKPLSLAKEYASYVVANDRLTITKSGRLLLPVAYAVGRLDTITDILPPAEIRVLFSDDNGRSWDTLPGKIFFTYSDNHGLQEPGIVELDDGRLWIYARTAYGNQYQAFSSDGGNTFSAAEPNLCFTSPDSPMIIKRFSRMSVAIFNPCGFNCTEERFEDWGAPRRTPFVCAVTSGDGSAFDTTGVTSFRGAFRPFMKSCYLIESDTNESYCYPTAIEVSDGFIVAYYHSNGSGICLSSGKLTKIRFDEIGL